MITKRLLHKLASFFGDRVHARRRRTLFLLALAIILVADLLMARGHVAFAWESLPGWSALFGFLSCLLLIFVAKLLGHRCKLRRREDYYD